MPLVLSVRSGESLFVGGRPFKLMYSAHPMAISLESDVGATTVLSPQFWAEIMPGVSVTIKAPEGLFARTVAVVIDAPRSIPILRGKLIDRPLVS